MQETKKSRRISVDGEKNSRQRPWQVTVVSLLLVFEACILFGVAALNIVSLINGERGTLTPNSVIFLAVFFIIFAVALLIIGHFLFRGRAWTRSPALVWQILMIIISFYTFQSPGYQFLAIATLVPGVVILILLFTKPLMRYVNKNTEQTR